MTATLDMPVYLAQVQNGRYLVQIDVARSEVEITDYPSVALHTTYREAEEIVQRLRKRGFRQSVVANTLGIPVSSDDLRAALQNERAATPAKAPLPKSMRDLDAIPARDRNQRYRADEEFRARVNLIYLKAGR
jgi:hypothetical protein